MEAIWYTLVSTSMGSAGQHKGGDKAPKAAEVGVSMRAMKAEPQ